MLWQGKDDNEAGWEKDKQETVNLDAREYNTGARSNLPHLRRPFYRRTRQLLLRNRRHSFGSFVPPDDKTPQRLYGKFERTPE